LVHGFGEFNIVPEGADTTPEVPNIGATFAEKGITASLEKMAEAAFSAAYDDGKKMSLEDAIAYALEES
jgi:hypothetical protein